MDMIYRLIAFYVARRYCKLSLQMSVRNCFEAGVVTMIILKLLKITTSSSLGLPVRLLEDCVINIRSKKGKLGNKNLTRK
jgi:hypothetical protein